MKNLLKKCVAEFIGSFAIIFAGCGAIIIHDLYPSSLPEFAIPAVFGLAVSVMIYALGHISGAHFNPAVTLAFAAVKRFGWKEVVPYWSGQFLGMLLAILFLISSFPEAKNIGVTTPNIGLWQAFLWEILLTFFLMFVIIAVATDSRAVGIMAGVAIGGTVMMNAMVGGAVTGASMNPARSFAPAVVSGQYQYLWLYILAPCLGAIAAAFVYEKIRCDDVAEKKEIKGCC